MNIICAHIPLGEGNLVFLYEQEGRTEFETSNQFLPQGNPFF